VIKEILMVYENFEIRGLNEYAKVTTYFLDNTPEIDMKRKRPLIVLCPGGAYWMVSDREAEPVALKLNNFGFHVAVVRYTTIEKDQTLRPFPEAITQVARTIAYFRENSEKYHIKKENISVMGFSAGAHLAGSVATFWKERWLLDILNGWDLELKGYTYKQKHAEDPAIVICDGGDKGCENDDDSDSKVCLKPLTAEDIKPNRLILCYPVISSGPKAHKDSFRNLTGLEDGENQELWDYLSLEKSANGDNPPTFIWHTFEDADVPVENSLMIASKLHELGVPVELHVYEKGKHGLSLGTKDVASEGNPAEKIVTSWPRLLKGWLTEGSKL